MLKRNVMIGAAVAVMSCGAMVSTQALEVINLTHLSTVGERVTATWSDLAPGGYSGSVRAKVGKFIMRDNATRERLEAFCTDVGVKLQNTWNYTPIADPVGAGLAGVVPPGPAWRDGGWEAASYLISQVSLTANSVNMAGLQVALWEVLYDGNYSLSEGRFKATSEVAGVIPAALNYLAIAAGADGSGNAVWLAPLANVNGPIASQAEDQFRVGGSQGLITQVPDGGVTLLLLGLGFGGLALFQNRARRRA